MEMEIILTMWRALLFPFLQSNIYGNVFVHLCKRRSTPISCLCCSSWLPYISTKRGNNQKGKGNKIHFVTTTQQLTNTNRHFFFLHLTWQTDHALFSGKQFLPSLGRCRVPMRSQAQHLRVPSTYFKM